MPISFLYAEDDPMSRQVMHVMLTKLALGGGAEVTIFEDSSNFMDRVKALPKVPDVIFLDVQITPHTGFEMLKMLRGDTAYDGKPIIAMTASVTVSDIEDLKKAGFDGLIAKPVRKKVFPELLDRILSGDAVWYVP
ncbi:MAG: response regulator [Phototrophicales bacterium]|nr:response regulator [Phototrophicales bacterium]